MTAWLLPLLLLVCSEEPAPTPVPPETRYPLGRLPARSLVDPDKTLVLTDLFYRARQEGSTAQTFAVRGRVKGRGFLSAFVDDQRRGVALETQRLRLGYFDDPSFTGMEAGYRGSRLLDASAERRPPQDGHGWVVDGELGLRLSPDLEAFLFATGDSDRGARIPRTLGRQGVSVLWQRGTRLDLSAAAERSERRTQAGFVLESLRASAAASGYARGSEADVEIGYERIRGPSARHEAFTNAALRSVIERRWLAELRTDNRWEPGVLWFDHEFRAGLTLHGRRVRLSRAGDAAARVLALTRRANEAGYNERREYDDDGRRRLRERLAISPRRSELASELQALHAAQIEERNVPLFGLSFAERFEAADGLRVRTLGGLLGMPWPPRWPWQADESVVPFLTARYTRVETQFGDAFTSHEDSAQLSIELSREMTLTLRTRRPGLTPLDVTFRTGHPRVWELEYSYALGR